MKNTKNLGLPIYDNPKSDLFKISDVNSAHTIIDETYEIMKNAKDHIVEIDENIPIKNADAEIVDARRGKSTLGEKIREIDSSLEKKLNKDGIVTMANLGQDVKTALTGGSVAVVGKNAILNDNVVNGQIFGRKTDFIEVDENCNLIDKEKLIANKRVQGGTDGNLVDSTGFYASDFLQIKPNNVYYYSNIYTGYYAFYDIGGNYISGRNTSTSTEKLTNPFTTPTNAYFMRITLNSDTQIPLSWIFTENKQPNEFKYKTKKINFNDTQKNEIGEISLKKIKENPINIEQVDFVSKIGSYNRIDKTKIKEGFYIKGQSQGEETVSGSTVLYCTDFCEIEPNKEYYHYGLYSGYYAFYNDDKIYISGVGSNTPIPNPFITPQNAKYVRFTLSDSEKLTSCWVNIENKIPPEEQYYVLNKNIIVQNNSNSFVENPVDYKGNEVSVFKKCLCIGDSLTYGVFNYTGASKGIIEYGYPVMFTKLTGIPCTNVGLASHDSKQWYDVNKNKDFSGHDFAIIQLGVNDVGHTTTNVDGGITDFRTETIIYLAQIIDMIKLQNKNIKIFVSTILPAYVSDDYNEMSEIIRSFVADRTDCYLLDVARYSRTVKGSVYERGHLTALGYSKLAEEYKGYIGYIIANNLEDFKYVHFIGTDYVY